MEVKSRLSEIEQYFSYASHFPEFIQKTGETIRSYNRQFGDPSFFLQNLKAISSLPFMNETFRQVVRDELNSFPSQDPFSPSKIEELAIKKKDEWYVKMVEAVRSTGIGTPQLDERWRRVEEQITEKTSVFPKNS